MRVEQQNHRLIIHDGRSECWIDPCGKDSLRVRMSAEPGMDDHDWALTEPVEATDVVIRSEVIDIGAASSTRPTRGTRARSGRSTTKPARNGR